jgi:predicted nucleotidyltransferase
MKKDYSLKLEKFEKFLKKFPEIKKITYEGSTATKSWDEYSDIDIKILVDEKNFKKFIKKLPKIFSFWGKINFIGKYIEGNEWYAYIGDNYFKIEIYVYTSEEKESEKKLSHKEFQEKSIVLRDWTIYISRHYARGQKFSAFYETLELRKELIDFLGESKGLKHYDFVRDAEKLMTPKEEKLIEGISIKSNSKKEIKEFIIGVWKLMDYIDSVWEKRTGKKLNLKINKKKTLEMILRTLK